MYEKVVTVLVVVLCLVVCGEHMFSAHVTSRNPVEFCESDEAKMRATSRTSDNRRVPKVTVEEMKKIMGLLSDIGARSVHHPPFFQRSQSLREKEI